MQVSREYTACWSSDGVVSATLFQIQVGRLCTSYCGKPHILHLLQSQFSHHSHFPLSRADSSLLFQSEIDTYSHAYYLLLPTVLNLTSWSEEFCNVSFMYIQTSSFGFGYASYSTVKFPFCPAFISIVVFIVANKRTNPLADGHKRRRKTTSGPFKRL